MHIWADQVARIKCRACHCASGVRPQDVFQGRELALLEYAAKLTLQPGDMVRTDVDNLKTQGLSDGEILEANQIICYFNYVNRSLNGLGVTTDNDVVGYYADSDNAT